MYRSDVSLFVQPNKTQSTDLDLLVTTEVQKRGWLWYSALCSLCWLAVHLASLPTSRSMGGILM